MRSHPRQSGSPWRGLAEIIVDGISDVLMLLDARTYEILSVNRAFRETYGHEGGDWTGKTCWEITHRRKSRCDEDGETCPVEQALRTGVSHAVEHRHLGADGEERYHEILVYPIRNRSGKVDKVIHLSRDITQRRKTEESLIHTERMAAISQVVATLAHEINNPLTGLLGTIGWLSRQEEMPPKVLQSLASLEEASGRIKRTVKKLEQLKRDTTKEYIPGIRMIDLDDAE